VTLATVNTIDYRTWYQAMPRRGWHEAAACRTLPTDLFFTRNAYLMCAHICARCPVVDDCLVYALRTELPSRRAGFYGGLTPKERSRFAAFLDTQGVATAEDAYGMSLDSLLETWEAK
jgi:hypothetical protein